MKLEVTVPDMVLQKFSLSAPVISNIIQITCFALGWDRVIMRRLIPCKSLSRDLGSRMSNVDADQGQVAGGPVVVVVEWSGVE